KSNAALPLDSRPGLGVLSHCGLRAGLKLPSGHAPPVLLRKNSGVQPFAASPAEGCRQGELRAKRTEGEFVRPLGRLKSFRTGPLASGALSFRAHGDQEFAMRSIVAGLAIVALIFAFAPPCHAQEGE